MFKELFTEGTKFEVGDVVKHRTLKPLHNSKKPIKITKVDNKNKLYKLSNATTLYFDSAKDWEIV